MATNLVEESIELDPNDPSSSEPASSERLIPQLKPVDRGRHAWQVLSAAFIFEALFWGFPTAFGIFQEYYSSLPEFQDELDSIPVIGTIAQGLYYLGAPFAAILAQRYPKWHRTQILAFWPLCILGLMAASFCDSIAGLIATQGVMYGIGFVLMTYPILSMLSEWWVVRRGLAFGLISASSGLTGIIMPFVLNSLLQRYGYKITLRACAVAMFVLTAPLLPLLRGRLPVSDATEQPKTNWSFLKKPLFWVYAIAVTVQGFGFFIPSIFLPSYAVAIGLSTRQAALLLAMMALAQTLGQLAFGWLSDKNLPIGLLTSFCCIVAAIASATTWGLGKSIGVLFIYSIVYGVFAYGFGTMRVAMGRAVSNDQSAVLATYSTFVFLQGIGNVMTGPIAAGLLSSSLNLSEYGASRYKGLIVLVSGSSMIAGVLIVFPDVIRISLKLRSK